jgi:integrase
VTVNVLRSAEDTVSRKTKVKGKQNNGLWQTKRGNLWTRIWRDGKTRWINLDTTNLVEAKKKLAELQEPDAALPWNGTLKQAVTEWLERLPNRRPNPKDQKLAKVRSEKYLLAFFPPDTRLSAIDHGHIEKYRAWLDRTPFKVRKGSERTGRKLSENTVAHILSDFRALLTWCETTKRLSGRRSPFVSRLVMPTVQELAPKDLSVSEVTALTSLPDPFGFTWRLLLGTGLRWGEACRAQAEHVRDGQLVVEITKGRRVRRIPLSAELLAEVRTHVGKLIPFDAGQPGPFARTCRNLTGLKGVHVHRARHTFAMRWLADLGSLAVLQQILGHRDLETTQRYAKVTEDLVRAEAKRIEERRRGA